MNYETINRELNKRLIHECRCDERRKVTDERSTHLTYTVLSEGLEHLKIESRFINERLTSVMGECVRWVSVCPHRSMGYFRESEENDLIFFSPILFILLCSVSFL